MTETEIFVTALLLINSLTNLWLCIDFTTTTAELIRLRQAGHNGLVNVLLWLFLFLSVRLLWDTAISIQNLPTIGVVITGVGFFRIAALATRSIINICGIIISRRFRQVWNNEL